MTKTRPNTTLFMLSSVDGKISTGSTDNMDFDADLPKISGVKAGLQQYYDLEQKTDLYSLNTGRVFAKVGMNDGAVFGSQVPVTFILIDNQPHLTKAGIEHITKYAKGLILVTTNPGHPAKQVKAKNLNVVEYAKQIDFEDLFSRLKTEFGVKSLTVQSGGTLNTELVRAGLIDKVSIVVAPVLVGGKDTPSIMDGPSLTKKSELKLLRSLTLVSCKKLSNSYVHMSYEVHNS